MTVFALSSEWTAPDVSALQEALSLNPFVGCGPTAEKAAGWVAPRGVEDDALLEVRPEHWLLRLAVERKSVPSSMVNAEVKRMQLEWEQQTGAPMSRKQVRELKGEALLNLLPKAFPKRSEALVWIDLAKRRVVLDCTSGPLVDEVLVQLGDALVNVGSVLAAAPLQPVQPVDERMATWLSEQNFPEDFSPDAYLELRSGGEDLASVRYSRHDLEIDEVVEHIRQGKRVLELGVVWQDRVAFHLCADLSLKKVELLNDVFVDGEDSFDADWLLYREELGAMLNALEEVLGHRTESGATDDTPENDAPKRLTPRGGHDASAALDSTLPHSPGFAGGPQLASHNRGTA